VSLLLYFATSSIFNISHSCSTAFSDGSVSYEELTIRRLPWCLGFHDQQTALMIRVLYPRPFSLIYVFLPLCITVQFLLIRWRRIQVGGGIRMWSRRITRECLIWICISVLSTGKSGY
jgi:hypothetical protein